MDTGGAWPLLDQKGMALCPADAFTKHPRRCSRLQAWAGSRQTAGVFAAIGRVCYRFRWAVLLVWIGVVVLAGAVGSQVFAKLTPEWSASNLESVQGWERLREASGVGPRTTALIDGVHVDDPVLATAVQDAAADLRERDGVAQVVDVYTAPLPELVAPDERAQLLLVDLEEGLEREEREAVVADVRQRVDEVADVTGADVVVGGQVLANQELAAQPVEDIEHGERITLPITLVVLVVVFGGLVAAFLPIVGALASIAGGLGGLYLFSFVMDLDPAVPAVTTVMGLALSIDYGLLVVSRYREERGRGRDVQGALEATTATAGRTIAFSALVVMVSLAGLFMFDVTIFRALGAAGVSVTVIAALSAITLVPALIALVHRRIRTPTTEVPAEGRFSSIARRVQRRPGLVVAGIGTLLLAGAVPFLSAEFANGGPEQLPRSFESRRFVDTLAERFPAESTGPVQVVAEGDAGTLDAYYDDLDERAGVAQVRPAQQVTPGLAVLEVVPEGRTQGPEARALVEHLRSDRPDVPTYVTGDAALLVDLNSEIRAGLPGGLAVLVTGAFVLLFLMTGSVLIPVKALIMNTLTLGAAFGVLVWGFQEGGLSDLLAFDPTGAIEPWLPVIIFAFAFGLSMDYEVFLLSRIKEMYDAGHSNDEAVALGLQRSGRIITSAALIMIIVFAGFATGQMLAIKELGVAMVVAVAVDATLVRVLLVPATMTLLGDWNWWAPGPLRRLHDRFGLSEHAELPPPPARRTESAPVG